jgi:hypothetical protein
VTAAKNGPFQKTDRPQAALTGSGVLSDPAFEKLRRSRGEFRDFHTALDFTLGVRKGGVARSYKRLPFVIDRLGGER